MPIYYLITQSTDSLFYINIQKYFNVDNLIWSHLLRARLRKKSLKKVENEFENCFSWRLYVGAISENKFGRE